MAKALQDLLSYFMLRRCKADVLSDLPPKTEFLLYAPLSMMQKHFYKRILKKDIHAVFGGSKKALTNVVMQVWGGARDEKWGVARGDGLPELPLASGTASGFCW